MFGVLNRFIARLDSEPVTQSSSIGPGDSSYGFQVLRNINTELPIEPWFDFIVGINGHLIDDPDPQPFAKEVSNCSGSSLSLNIWSAKGQQTHQISIAVPPAPGTLGLTLQSGPLNTTQNIWHIMSIPSPFSPAHLAGLLPHSDYILGTPSGALRGEAALGELVEDHLNRSLVLWVYNSEFDVAREVELIPRRDWGGEGALGAVLGFGALHRLPVGLGEEMQAPGEKMFEAEQRASVDRAQTENDGNFIVPAESSASMQQQPLVFGSPDLAPPRMVSPSAPLVAHTPGAAAMHGRKARTRVGAIPSKAFDDMFEEGYKQSQEQDLVPSKKGTPVRPPPKVSVSDTAIAPNTEAASTLAPPLQTKGDLQEPRVAEAT